MPSIACIIRPDFAGSGSLIIFPRPTGTSCHDTPQRSFSHPHMLSCPPFDVSAAQSLSSSAWVSQFTSSDMASVNLNLGPPLSATKSCPASWKATVSGLPSGPRVRVVMRESGKSDV